MATIDLKDAYLHIPDLWAHRKFLKTPVYHNNSVKHLQFMYLPFCLILSTRVFKKIVAVLTAFFRMDGAYSIPNLED